MPCSLCAQIGKERARHAALMLNLLAAQALLASGQVRVLALQFCTMQQQQLYHACIPYGT